MKRIYVYEIKDIYGDKHNIKACSIKEAKRKLYFQGIFDDEIEYWNILGLSN